MDGVVKTVRYPEAAVHQHPTVVADIDSTFDLDPGILRYDGPPGTEVKLKTGEGTSADAESSHSPETIGIFVGE